MPKSQRGKYKEKITNTHGSIYIVVHAAPSKEGFVSASFNSHCVAFLSLHINVLFIKV